MIAGMTGVMIETTDEMTEIAVIMDGIADEVTIVITIADTLIAITAHATTTDRANSHLTVRQI